VKIRRTHPKEDRVLRTGAIALLIFICILFIFAGGVYASGEGEKGTGWIATDTYRAINFVVLAVALFIILRKPAAQALGSRIQDIKQQLDELEEKKRKAEEELVHYNEQLSLLDEKAEAVVEEYIRQGNETREKILEAAATAAEKLEDRALRRIEQEFEHAKVSLQDEVFKRALAMAEEKIASNITTDYRDRLVDNYIVKVEER
jgi:F-type H+-transporting ATPase subunit b